MITVATLIAAGINPTQARLFAEPLAKVCALYEINTPLRVAHFVGQCGHESGGFARLEESLWYSRPEGIRANWPTRVINLAMAQSLVGKPQALANTVYANRFGNGDTMSGDGWKYRGRGLIQLTFRDNYARCGTDCGLPYAEQPELVALPGDACITAGWYWKDKHINSLADTGSVESVTRAINSKLLGIDDRKRRTAMALEAFS
jgi:putative chitinase